MFFILFLNKYVWIKINRKILKYFIQYKLEKNWCISSLKLRIDAILKKLGTTCNMGLEFLASWTVITTILSDWIFHKLKLHVLIKRTVFLKNTLSIFYLHAQVIFLKEEGVWWTDVWESFRSFTFWFKKMKLSELPEPSYPLHEQVILSMTLFQ